MPSSSEIHTSCYDHAIGEGARDRETSGGDALGTRRSEGVSRGIRRRPQQAALRALMALFMGQDPQARQFVEKALEIDGYPADRTWVDTPTVLDVAARGVLAQNRISDAVVLARDTVQRYLAQTSSRAKSYRIACARMTLGEALAQDRRASSEAHEQFSQAYAIFKATFGADHPTTHQALERLNGQSTAATRRDPRGC